MAARVERSPIIGVQSHPILILCILSGSHPLLLLCMQYNLYQYFNIESKSKLAMEIITSLQYFAFDTLNCTAAFDHSIYTPIFDQFCYTHIFDHLGYTLIFDHLDYIFTFDHLGQTLTFDHLSYSLTFDHLVYTLTFDYLKYTLTFYHVIFLESFATSVHLHTLSCMVCGDGCVLENVSQAVADPVFGEGQNNFRHIFHQMFNK